jgi:peptide/nickel transport system ATP-binding protein
MTLLAVENLGVSIKTAAGTVEAVRDVSFILEPRTKLGIVGESGSGKSMTALSIIRLLPLGAAATGRVVYKDRNLLALPDKEMCRIRGNAISVVFQEPMTSLNPLHTVSRQIVESLALHRGLVRREAEAEALRLLERVGIPQARRRLSAYPHQLSGGQRQRVMIAIALSCGPDILIADEPTTALDVTTQRQVLDLLDELVEESGMAMILISHNLAMIGERADHVAVMYGGRIVETAPTAQLFRSLAHPYTRGLFAALPRLGGRTGHRLPAIPGTVPDLAGLGEGCAFADRCPKVSAQCRAETPRLDAAAAGHLVACYHRERAAP